MTTVPSSPIGTRIRQQRIARHLSQRRLAKLAGVALGTVQAVEANQRQPRAESLVRLADALALPRDQLLVYLPGSYTAQTAIHDLTDEDVLVARAHHHASSDVRRHVQDVLVVASSRLVALPLATPGAQLTLSDYRLLFRMVTRLNEMPAEDRQSALQALALTLDLDESEEVQRQRG